jgi:hypothetical protein
MTASQVWREYNGNPALLSQGLLELLHDKGYNVWLFRPNLTGDDIHLQAADFAQAVQFASKLEGYNGKVTVAGYSLGGLVMRTAMSRWDWDATWRNSLALDPAPPVNLLVALDSPLRGAIVSNDLQHAFWNATINDGKAAHQHNMDSCAAQQMLESSCRKPAGFPDDLQCDDREWYETFYGGNSFFYCNPDGTGSCFNDIHSCMNPGFGILTQPNGGWPAGIKKIGASMGNFGERTGVCYGPNDKYMRDSRGDLSNGCPAVAGYERFDLGNEWGYIYTGILSSDRTFIYKSLDLSADPARQHYVDELTPGSRQSGSVEGSLLSWWILQLVSGRELLHPGTFIPLYSALDVDPSTGAIPFDEYWTNSYDAFHDAVADKLPGNWFNQTNLDSGSLTLPQWLVKNLDDAFNGVTLTVALSGAGTVTSSPTGISCGAICSNSFPTGTLVTLTASPSAGSIFAGWIGAGCSGTGTCAVTMNAAQSVTATFNSAPASLSLAVSLAGTGTGTVTSSPAGISCGSTCGSSFTPGTVVTLTASPAAGSTFTGWSGAGCSGAGACSVTMNVAQSVSATFNSASSGCGEATCVPAQAAYISHFTGAGCTGTESYYTPYNGGSFSCRTWDGNGVCGTIHRTVTNVSFKDSSGACTDAWTNGNTLSDFVTVYRGGGSTSFVLSVGLAGTGSVVSSPSGISCGGNCSSSFAGGTVVTLTASPSGGSTFVGWSGAGCSGAGTCSVTMNAAQSVTATFNSAPASFSLAVSLAGTGTGTVTSSPAGISCGSTCGSSFNAGTVVTLTASPAAGSTFVGWSGGCSGAGACSVTMNAAQSVSATFNTASSSACGEATCVPAQAAYISHFTGAGCTGTESYYTPYNGGSFSCRTWDGTGVCGTIHRTVTNVSWKDSSGACTDAWPGGNTLSDFVTVYR